MQFYFNVKKKIVGLTIDDAPGENVESNLEMLEILDKFNAKATFFLIGENVINY